MWGMTKEEYMENGKRERAWASASRVFPLEARKIKEECCSATERERKPIGALLGA